MKSVVENVFGLSDVGLSCSFLRLWNMAWVD